ncbi:uncharacterized protein [Littorina saxatilis]|uniref:uncharacterized protein n=1 Tax=Littorina saxatilis TaxID=31220 RepID=UPI0038B5365A
MKRGLKFFLSVMGCFPTKISPGYDKIHKEKEDEANHKDKKVLRGDVTQRYEARKIREEKLRQRQIRITSAAEELSHKVMEERERLSINSKSRATSRTTSRAGSPSFQRKQVTFNTVPCATNPRLEMSQVAEVTDGAVESSASAQSRDQNRTLTNGIAVSVT